MPTLGGDSLAPLAAAAPVVVPQLPASGPVQVTVPEPTAEHPSDGILSSPRQLMEQPGGGSFATHKRRMQADPPLETSQAEGGGQMGAGVTAASGGASTSSAMDVDATDALVGGPAAPLPLHFIRVLLASARDSANGPQSSPWSAHSLLLSAVHAAMLETGFRSEQVRFRIDKW